MSKSDTWMPLYIGDYLADTMHLCATEHGAYLLLIMHYWRTGPLPDDDRALSAIARCERKAWCNELSATLRPFFDAVDGRLHHKRIDHELANSTRLVEQRRVAGKASAAARAGQRKSNENPTGVATDDALPLARNGRPSPSPSQKERKTVASQRRADSPDAAPDEQPVDAKTELFRSGLATVSRISGKPGGRLRALFGQWLRDLGDDASVLNALIMQADVERKAEPIAWISAAVKAAASPRQRPERPGKLDWMIAEFGPQAGQPDPEFAGMTVDATSEEIP